jgi:hypothetical protein
MKTVAHSLPTEVLLSDKSLSVCLKQVCVTFCPLLLQKVLKETVDKKSQLDSISQLAQQLIDSNAHVSPVVMRLSSNYQNLVAQCKVKYSSYF